MSVPVSRGMCARYIDPRDERIAELEAGYRHLLGQVVQGQLAREFELSPSVKAAVDEAKRLLGVE